MITFRESFKWPQFMQVVGNAHGRHPCPISTTFDTVCKLRNCPAIYRTFFTKRTPKNAKLIENRKIFLWCLQLVIIPWKKGSFTDVDKWGATKRTLLSYLSTLRWTWYFFTNLSTGPQLFQAGRHDHGRHQCQVWKIFGSICKLYHI